MHDKFIIEKIVHNGNKGERGSPVTDIKYDGLVGCPVSFNMSDIHIGYSLTMYIAPYAHRLYDWFTVSCIQDVVYDPNEKMLIIETINSIYYLKEIEYDKRTDK